MSGLTHLDDEGRARMIDVGGKAITRREAVARGRLETTDEVVRLLVADGLPKADALATARLAGIQGAKRTGDLIPLAHPLPIDGATVSLTPQGAAVEIEARVSTSGRTGVEMEALTAVAVAGLALHDMVKAVDPAAQLTAVRLVEKSGGKRGHWVREGEPVAEEAAAHTHDAPAAGTAAVLVVSTQGAAGTREDTTGPRIVGWLREAGFAVGDPVVVADADVADGLAAALAPRPALLLTTGGTGPSPTDRTPEATAAMLETTLPGVAEAIRARGAAATPTAALSRGLAGVARGTVVVNLPGSAGGVADGLSVLADLLPHLLQQVRGHADHARGAHQSPDHPAPEPA